MLLKDPRVLVDLDGALDEALGAQKARLLKERWRAPDSRGGAGASNIPTLEPWVTI